MQTERMRAEEMPILHQDKRKRVAWPFHVSNIEHKTWVSKQSPTHHLNI